MCASNAFGTSHRPASTCSERPLSKTSTPKEAAMLGAVDPALPLERAAESILPFDT
jgi:chemotaxis response regulator CheB